MFATHQTEAPSSQTQLSVRRSEGALHGQTGELGYHVVDSKMTIRDLQATLLHQCGLNPYSLSLPLQVLNNRLIGPTEEAKIAKALLAEGFEYITPRSSAERFQRP